MEEDWAQLIGVFHAAIERAQEGQKSYGQYNPETDSRNMLDEAIEELLDCIVYCGLQIIKLRHLNARNMGIN